MYGHPKYGGRRELMLLCGAVAVLFAAIFRADIFSGADIYFKVVRDINPLTLSYPWSRLSLMSWSEGYFPLWNQYNLLGLPHLANYQSGVFSPLLLPLTFLPLDWMAAPYLYIRLAIAACGAYLFLKRNGMSVPAAAAGALAFSLSGFMVQYVNDQNLVIDILVPWLLLAGQEMVERRKTAFFIMFALVTWLILLGGQPGSALFALGLGYAFSAVLSLSSPGNRTAGLLLTAGAGALALVAALPQLLPFFEYLTRAWTFRMPGFGSEHIPPAGWTTLIMPGFLGKVSLFGKLLPTIKIVPYMGAAIAALAISGLLRPSGKKDIFFLAVLAISAAVLAGIPPVSLFTRIKGLDQLTYIKYMQVPFFFSLSFLAAKGVDAIYRGEGLARTIAGAAIVAGAAVAMRILVGPEFREATSFMNGAAMVAVAFAIVVSLLSCGSARTGSVGAKRTAAWACALLIAVELVTASVSNAPVMFSDPNNIPEERVEKIASQHAPSRISASEKIYVPNQNLFLPAYELGASDAMLIQESADLAQWMMGMTPVEFKLHFLHYHSLRPAGRISHRGIADLLSLGAELSSEAINKETGQPVNSIRIYENRTAMPRAWLAKKVIKCTDKCERFDLIKKSSNEKKAVMEKEAPIIEGATGDVSIHSAGLQSISLDVKSDGPGILVLADAYYPGWVAYVNWNEQRVHKVNHGLRGVEVPAGDSTVDFFYAPLSFGTGLWAGLSAIFSVLLLYVRSGVTRRR